MKELKAQLHKLLDEEKFMEARNLINENLDTGSFLLQIELFGFLIDIGILDNNENDLIFAIEFLRSNEDQILKCISKSSYYYNLANAVSGMAKIYFKNNRGVPPLHLIKDKLHEPIKYYWLAYKNITDIDKGLFSQILINLSNSLADVARIVESLQFLDTVLLRHPKFPNALISKADTLHSWNQISNTPPTISLYAMIYNNYKLGIETNKLPPSILQRCIYYKEKALKEMKDEGYQDYDIQKEVLASTNQFNELSDFRKYSISNFLTLNEHSLYCNCIASEKDNLQIGVPNALFNTDIVSIQELLLNRIKSEFSLARWLFYKSIDENANFEFDTKYTELFEQEIINPKAEMQRSSFRLCYGILDKIALGICKLYNLDSKKIYFETFWDTPDRWHALQNIRNIHLNALYSIACDLNTTTGELKQFKKWRNDLEHNLLVLKDFSKPNLDLFKIFEQNKFVSVIDVNEFKGKTLHLLQLTRSAIFSYVYCVRKQSIAPKDDNINAFPIDFKD
jgi:hypothetical protein